MELEQGLGMACWSRVCIGPTGTRPGGGGGLITGEIRFTVTGEIRFTVGTGGRLPIIKNPSGATTGEIRFTTGVGRGLIIKNPSSAYLSQVFAYVVAQS